MTNPDPDPLSAADRDWVQARVAALGGDAARVHDALLSAGPDGRIVLSTGAGSAVPALDDAGGAAVFALHSVRVGAGQSLLVQSPDGRPVKVVAGVLEVGDGGRVVVEAHAELGIARAAFGTASPSEIEFVGKDGPPGNPGGGGTAGSKTSPDGGNGGGGDRGGPGDTGPDGRLAVEQVSGQVRVVARGGNGGPGGPGGPGGAGWGSPSSWDYEGVVGSGGNGGPGGPGGRGGDGGTIVFAIGSMAPGSSIQPVTSNGRGGAGGKGGARGQAGDRDFGRPGAPGPDGTLGDDGDPPRFLIRPRD